MIDALVVPMTNASEPFWTTQRKGQSQYEFIRSHIRGLIEPVELGISDSGSVWMYVHEEGKVIGLGINRRANALLHAFARHLLLEGDFIVGTAILVGSIDGDGNHRKLTARQRQQISDALGLRDTQQPTRSNT